MRTARRQFSDGLWYLLRSPTGMKAAVRWAKQKAENKS